MVAKTVMDSESWLMCPSRRDLSKKDNFSLRSHRDSGEECLFAWSGPHSQHYFNKSFLYFLSAYIESGPALVALTLWEGAGGKQERKHKRNE